jgi:hypothetical protein
MRYVLPALPCFQTLPTACSPDFGFFDRKARKQLATPHNAGIDCLNFGVFNLEAQYGHVWISTSATAPAILLTIPARQVSGFGAPELNLDAPWPVTDRLKTYSAAMRVSPATSPVGVRHGRAA